jgi:periplasmic protein TonB
MPFLSSDDVYSAREIALAAGVSEAQVVALLGAGSGYVGHDEAVRIGRVALLQARQSSSEHPESRAGLFAIFSEAPPTIGSKRVFALSSTVHATVLACCMFMAALDLAPRAATLKPDEQPADPMRLVFLATPGPGGGGGGGGLVQKAPAPKALREGRQRISSPLPIRREPEPIVPAPEPPKPPPPPPPLAAETLPAVVAPIIAAPADTRNRVGVLQQTTAESDSHGPGKGGDAGTGAGTGLGEGDGSGVGPGSGGGTGGGPYRPGSGIEPPRLLKEVRADYTEDARQRGLSGDVVLEIVVRRDGSVGDIKILRGLAGGLNERAVQAVRQWRFAPARRQGAPVDVVVEVAVEFKLR